MQLFTLDQLNPLEKSIHQTLSSVQNVGNLGISQAAELCDVSISKISKFVKKVGFSSYKDYRHFIDSSWHLPVECEAENELKRIQAFLEDFDAFYVRALIRYIERYDKIVLFGYGPSFINLEYFESKLRLVSDKNIVCLSAADLLGSILNEDSLVIISSTTGRFSSFSDIFKQIRNARAKSLLVLEEYNNSFSLNDTDLLYLTQSRQKFTNTPYVKTRSLSFIFFEEVFREMYLRQNGLLPHDKQL
ncbi:MurR/RpiR family transcriptional regulator [Lactovum odontotermitis]